MDKVDIPAILAVAPSPAYVIDLGRLRHNLSIFDYLQQKSGARVLLAMKAFSMWNLFSLISQTLYGVCASSPWEAMLGREEFGKEVHSFAAAFKESDVKTLLPISNHLVFNSFAQLEKFRPLWQEYAGKVSIGLRVNPEHSEGHTPLYDPCAPNSRLGVVRKDFEGKSLEAVEGLHFHTLCEHKFEPLHRTAKVFEDKFGEFLPQMKWINFGGGHHITSEGYDMDALIELVIYFREKYDLKVYLEPGEAVAIGTGILTAQVLDIVSNHVDNAILDVSATCHLPDCLEMPYRPEIYGAAEPGLKPYTYRIGGPSCLAGDVLGDWSFDEKLKPGDPLAFEDMGHYTMVKTTTFNGIQHPAICTWEPETQELKIVREFNYSDFKHKLS